MRSLSGRWTWLLATALACVALFAGVAFGRSGSAAARRIVFGMNHFCLTKSPNGPGKIPTDCGRGEIAVVDADGSHLRVLTHDKVTETSPAWSPDGRQIAFVRPTPHTSDQLWVMNADGTHKRALTRFRNAPQLFGQADEPDLSWSPDGRQIVFAAWPTNQGGVQQLYLVTVRTHAVRRLTNLSVGTGNPVWSPNGRWIAVLGNMAPDRIFLVSPGTHHVHQLTYRGGPVGGLGLAWSPDSRRLAFNMGGKLQTLDADGNQLHSLGLSGEEPSWSPDGQWIVYVNGDNMNEVRPDGSGLHSILHVDSQKGWNFEPNWRR